MDPATYLLAPLLAALVTAIGAWAWNHHKPTVDRNVSTIDGFDKLAQRLQADNDDLREQVGELRGRVTTAEKRVTTVEEVAATERQHSRTQDIRIAALQKAVESWTRWGNWLHTEWSSIRLNEQPPDLPKTEEP